MESKVYEKAEYIKIGDAWWGPISCGTHEKHDSSCVVCIDLRDLTKKHIYAVTEEVPW